MAQTASACPACGRSFRVSNEIIGKKVRCRKCGAVLVAQSIGGQTLLQLASVSKTAAPQPPDTKDSDFSVPLQTPVSWSKVHGESFFVICPGCGFHDCLHAGFEGRQFTCPRCARVFLAKRTSFDRQPPRVPDAAVANVARVEQTRQCPFCGETILAVAKKCKHCHETIDATSPAASPFSMIDATSPAAGPSSSSRTLLGCCLAGALILAFSTTAWLLIYFIVKPAEEAEREEVASGQRTEHDEPSRLLESPARASDRRPTRTPEPLPAEVLPKTLASMDKLTIAIAPLKADEAPTPEIWRGHTASIRGVAFTDDGRFVVSVSGAIEKIGARTDNSIRVWDARRGKQVHKLDGFREALDAVSVSPGGRFAVFGYGGHYEGGKFVDSIDHRLRLWDIQDNKEFYFQKGLGGGDSTEARFAGLDSSVFSTAFSPDRQKVVGVDNSGRLIVWDSRNGQSLISGKVDAVPRQRDDGGLLTPISFTVSGIDCIRFTPDGRRLLASGADYTVRLLDAATGEELHLFESHQDIVWAVDVMQTKGGQLLGLSGGGLRQRLKGDGHVPGARDYAIRLWDLETHQEVRRFLGHAEEVLSLAFRPNGRHFLSASGDQTVRLWDIESGKLLRIYRGHTGNIRSVSVSPDGRAAVSGGDDCMIRYWRLPASVEDMILALDKKSQADLRAAMRDLDTMGPELRSAYPKLIETICQSDKAMGELALSILQQLGRPDREWVNGLCKLLTSSLAEGRLFAAKALAQLSADALPALTELRKALRDTDPAVRRNVATALANIGKDAREADDDLGQLVERETDDEVKTKAIHALGKIGGKSQLKKLFRGANDAFLLVAVLDALGDADGLDRSMVSQLLNGKGLQHAVADVRSKALDSLRRVGLDTLPVKTLADLALDDASPKVRKNATTVLSERMGELSDADMKDVRALLEMTGKPEAVRIGLEAVRHMGPKAKEVLPELLKRLPGLEGKLKLDMALALAAIDANNEKVIQAVGPILVAALRPEDKDDEPSEAVLKAIAAIGKPITEEIFKALEAADAGGVINLANRKALYLALQQLGRKAYSASNAEILKRYWKAERLSDVQAEAGRALTAMLPP